MPTETTAFDEFWEGIWWVPDGTGMVRNATPGECAAEIKRLRTVLEDIAGAQMMWHGGVGRPPYDLVAGHIDCMKQMATEALNHAYP